ncbi:MAG TPA: GNAT family N-acetyltransferase, partial [Candidatus Micrarchaeota archaeon]|nr:GNAT family N-acetyltransferase [Candidatus Micrarchaeota archaeon]
MASGRIVGIDSGLFPKYLTVQLSSKDIPRRPSKLLGRKSTDAERLFSGACKVITTVLPDQGDTKETLRTWVHTPRTAFMFFNVAIDRAGTVAGASLTDYIPEMNVAYFLRVAVDQDFRRQGIAKLLVK